MRQSIRINFIALIATVIFFAACSSDPSFDLKDVKEVNPPISNFAADPDGDGHDHSNHPGLGYESEIMSYVDTLGIDFDSAEEIDFFFPDGTSEKRYLVEGDIVMTRQEMEELKGTTGNIESRQFRTYNLVNNNQVITIRGYTGGSYALTSKMKTALSWAVANYNALNTGLTFSLSYGASTNADIVVYRLPNGQAGGQAGFPYSNGNPYKWVRIFSGMESYNTNTIEHVITHEIGHCLGLRHTDYFNRASCGGGGESAGSVGAVFIPGTPLYDWSSVMLACFSSNEDGEFSYYDRVALERLY